ncbi:MAG: hypothetical protein CM1200mP16_00660 [Nitrospina sp.]|nr:MAG: hypothetical protein CM1200mP16_00660 [Nitrospina sp.]
MEYVQNRAQDCLVSWLKVFRNACRELVAVLTKKRHDAQTAFGTVFLWQVQSWARHKSKANPIFFISPDFEFANHLKLEVHRE